MSHADDPMRLAFEEALQDDPYDLASRSVYADWLEEQGRDDEAHEQRRRATPEWCEAHKYLCEFAKKCGMHCESGYGDWHRDDDGRIHVDHSQEVWVEMTYEMVVEAANEFIDSHGSEWFTQVGQERARDQFCYEGGEEEKRKFWRAWSVVTGRPLDHVTLTLIDEMGTAPFSCTC